MPEFSVGYAGTLTIEAEDADEATEIVEGHYELVRVAPGAKPVRGLFIVYALPLPDPLAPKAEVVN